MSNDGRDNEVVEGILKEAKTEEVKAENVGEVKTEEAGESKCLNIKEIWAADDLRVEKVEVPEWGGHLFIQSLTGEERDRFEATIFEKKGEDTKTNFENLRAKLIVLTAVDTEGNKIFRSENAPRLGTKNSAVLDRLFAVAQKLSGLRKEDVDELVKN